MKYRYYIKRSISYYNMVKKTFLCVFTIFVLSSTTSSGEEISKTELIDIIQGLERNFSVVEYQMIFKTLRSQDDNKVDFNMPLNNWLNNAEPEGVVKRTYCLTEPNMGRIYFKREGTGYAQNADSTDTYIREMYREFGFDGQTRTVLLGLPDEQRNALIEEEPLHINKEISSFEMGMDMLLFCYRGMGLSQYLLSNQVVGSSVRGALQENGNLEVTYIIQKGEKKRRLIIDISKGGAILSEEYFQSGSDENVVVKMEYTWQKNDSGYWVPNQGIGVQGQFHPILFVWIFNEVYINHFKPTPDKYRVIFPPGTRVDDRKVGISYVVGELPRDVVLEVQKNLIQTVELNPDLVDETEDNLISSDKEVSISQLREKNEDSNDINNITAVTEFSKNSSLSRVFLWVLSVIGLLILLILMLIYVRIKKEKTVCIILLLFLLSFQQESFAGKNDGIQLKYFDGWTSQGCGDKRIQIYQCGLNSGVYVLEYFKKKYDIGQLMDLMTPVLGKGISLSDIIKTLQLYGLEVRAMKGVSADDLCTHLNRNLIALLPTNTSGKKGHYYIVIPGRKCEFVLVNAGISVSNCSKKQIQKMLSRNNGIVAFIGLDREVSDATKIKLSMVEYDLGMFPLTPQKELIAKFELNNISDEEVLLRD